MSEEKSNFYAECLLAKEKRKQIEDGVNRDLMKKYMKKIDISLLNDGKFDGKLEIDGEIMLTVTEQALTKHYEKQGFNVSIRYDEYEANTIYINF